jgi:hypothetical protein
MEHRDDGGALATPHLLARVAYASDEGSPDEHQALFAKDAELIVEKIADSGDGREAATGQGQRPGHQYPARGARDRR